MNDQHPSILIVDDSAVTRAAIKRTIAMTGLEVGQLHEAGDGKAALEFLQSHPVDLVLADLNMPVMDGMEMIRRMRESDALRNIPVAVISAQPDESLIEQLKRDGVIGYLPKPFTPEAVRDLIAPCLSRKAPKPVTIRSSYGAVNLTLIEALGESLETMAFVSPELLDAPSEATPSPDAILVRVGFHGQGIKGSLELATTHAFGSVIAANCCDGDPDADADDALKELTNVTCGSLLRRRIGGAVGFELEVPVVSSIGDGEHPFVGADTVVLTAEGHLVFAHVVTNKPLFEVGG